MAINFPKPPDADATNKVARELANRGLSIPPPPQPPSSGPLANLFHRPIVQGLYYNGKTVPLDGYTFNGCRFDNCLLTLRGVNFELINCVVDPSTRVQYGADIGKVIRLFHAPYDWADENIPAFAPIRNPDGSITVNSDVR